MICTAGGGGGKGTYSVYRLEWVPLENSLKVSGCIYTLAMPLTVKRKVASRRKKANQYRSFQKKKISRFEYYSVNFFGLVTFTCYVCAGS